MSLYPFCHLLYDLLTIDLFVNLCCRQPHKLCLVWTRHGRHLCSEIHSWESRVDDPYLGVVSWSVPENITAVVTLFHSGKMAKSEDKNWMFIVENVSKTVIFNVYSMLLPCDTMAKCSICSQCVGLISYFKVAECIIKRFISG